MLYRRDGTGGGRGGGQRRLTVFLPIGEHHQGAGPALARDLPSWRQLPFNPFMLASSSVASPAPPSLPPADATATQAGAGSGGGYPSDPHPGKVSQQRQVYPVAPPGRHGAMGRRGMRGGRDGAAAAAMPADYPFYCDPCQKGFRNKEAYDTHMEKHMYCTVPGCHFTCKADKAWKMEAHMDLLHNRPDAPALADPEQYLAQRRRRFPTQEAVKQRVEELYYKAARGVVMPDERRRWMRQHGIHIGKRLWSEHTYIARGALSDANETEEAKPEEGRGGPPSHTSARSSVPSSASSPSEPSSSAASSRSGSRGIDHTRHTPVSCAESASEPPPVPAAVVVAAASLSVPKSAAARLERLQQDAEARRVPRFYVCARCGVKGEHWVRACPTLGDDRFDRHLHWGEPKREGPQPPHRVRSRSTTRGTTREHSEEVQRRDAEGMTRTHLPDPSEPAACGGGEGEGKGEPSPQGGEETGDRHSHSHPDSDVDDGPPPTKSARQEAGGGEASILDGAVAAPRTGEVTRVIAPVAAARRAAAAAAASGGGGRGGRGRMVGRGRGRGRHSDGPPSPSLYERLTEEDRLNDNGLLLQAIRFFVARGFLQP